ncbi:MAG TPA: Ppx/GppA phosphatase family protein [Candidatus Limnocylindria bacterium]|nr:Ppx/GppA phosphatase family protein [Candidatus Limnocylindria bacterium]
MRIAAIDIGTNSIHMVIAQATTMGAFDVVDREREVVQIGRGSFTGGRLRAEAIRRTVEALARYVQLARRHQVDKILCTATAAVREARNGGEFLTAAYEASGIAPRVIPVEEEGRLIYLAVKAALGLEEAPSLIVDIGGGSMQLVVGTREKLLLASGAPLGALRLTETLLENDPPGRRELQVLQRTIQKQSRELLQRVKEHEPVRVYGSSGSIHALAHIAHWAKNAQPIANINGHLLSVDALKDVTRKLSRMTVAERERLPGIDAQRAGIILPGALVLSHVLEEMEAEGITISDFGVREGLVTDYINVHAEEISEFEDVEDLRVRSVLALLKKFDGDGQHPRHVAKLALALFDQLRTVHELPPAARDVLHFAALLHDVGAVIGYDGHAEHSYYVIKHGNLRGLSPEDLELVANVARYHSKARPRKRHADFRGLDKTQQRTARWLAALLRIAEGLDRSHYQLIRGLRVVRRDHRVSILVTARRGREAQLEIWASRRRTDLLSRVLGGKGGKTRVRVALDTAAGQSATGRAATALPPSAGAKPGPATRTAAVAGKSEPGNAKPAAKESAAKPAARLKVVPKR